MTLPSWLHPNDADDDDDLAACEGLYLQIRANAKSARANKQTFYTIPNVSQVSFD